MRELGEDEKQACPQPLTTESQIMKIHRENKRSDQRKQQIQQILITKHSRNLRHNKKNLRIIGIEEGEELQIKGPENIFNKIIEENFPNLKNNIPMKVQE